ncbi:hypothetical protein NKI63_22965 [Mesorhizobium sp. M0410]|uniref:hypothetical protein n=1 Tax=Mesorhizobium sp. M0410 TaxID=2956943 RepID=UPI003338B998
MTNAPFKTEWIWRWPLKAANKANPNPTEFIIRAASTSLGERQILTMRMQMRPLTRLANAFSKKVRKPRLHGCAVHRLVHFIRVHKTLKNVQISKLTHYRPGC